MNTITKPDYVFWCKCDEWTFKDAALLLHGFEPLNWKRAKFNVGKVPDEPELHEAYKTFLLLKYATWKGMGLITNNSTHPYAIQEIARYKDLPFPQEITKHLEARRIREEENPHPSRFLNTTHQEMEVPAEKNKDVSAHARERRNLLKTIGLLILILEGNKNLSASQLKNIILEQAEHLNIETDGLKSIDRKISEAMAIINTEMHQ